MSKVYFTDMSTRVGVPLTVKFKNLLLAAGIKNVDFDGKFTAVKMHFGEAGNLAFLRHNYARVLCDTIKECGGKPYLTDCNTLYVGSRKNALDHLDNAYANGFNPLCTGVHTIIADGIKGTDEVEIPLPDGIYCSSAKIGKGIMDADVFVSLTHAKCHEGAGFGGVLKNIGMGCGSFAGKKDMHSSGKPDVNADLCIGCGKCTQNCAHGAPVVSGSKVSIDLDKCVGCARCIGVCPQKALTSIKTNANEILNYKITEYAAAVLRGRPAFHVALVVDVSPNCDCHCENDAPVVPNVGMFASFDPVSLDVACADAINAQEPIGKLKDKPHIVDNITSNHPETNWQCQIDRAVEMGLGEREYEIITVK